MAVRSLAQSSLVEPFNTNSMLAGYSGNAFHHLETVRLSSNAASVTFSNLARYADYQHLQVRMVTRADIGGGSIATRFNADTGNNYSTHRLFGTGSSVVSDAFTNYPLIWGGINSPSTPTEAFGASVLDILDPFETTKYTTTRAFTGRSTEFIVMLLSGSWRNSAAVTQIALSPNAGNFIAGSRFSLYGIKARA